MVDSMSRALTSHNPGERHGSQRTCCGVIRETKYQVREKRAQNAKPQPWIVLKLMVFITVALMAYAAYVYIGRFCVPMLRNDQDALGSRSVGIVFLIIFVPLFLMMLWTYERVVVTPPGFAKDHIPQTSQPMLPPPPRHEPNHPAVEEQGARTVAGTRYENHPPGTPLVNLSRIHSHTTPTTPHSTTRSSTALSNIPARPQPSYRSQSHRGHQSISGQSTARSSVQFRADTSDIPDPDSDPPAVDMSPPFGDAAPRNVEPSLRVGHEGQSPQQPRPRLPRPFTDDLPPPLYSRHPRTTPVLLPEYRYCPRDCIVKPYRAHHCRSCGTCVLKYDHHCPWVGQCVGARNQKFFVNFLEWALIACSWIFSTLVAFNAMSTSKPNFDIDPQHIVVIAFSGLFILFCATMLITDIRLILLNQTTVESLQAQQMKERESVVLSRLHSWWEFRAKHRTKKQWDQEWGRIDLEGNLWTLGSSRANWEAVMGQNWYEWLLPIGRSSGDGLTFTTNPRFDEQGRWRRRREWPKELQG